MSKLLSSTGKTQPESGCGSKDGGRAGAGMEGDGGGGKGGC